MQKTELKKSSFFNVISLENKGTKLPQDYMEKEESKTSLTESFKMLSQYLPLMSKLDNINYYWII